VALPTPNVRGYGASRQPGLGPKGIPGVISGREVDNVEERVKNVKFMWGIFACNELLFKRFGMGESEKCSLCKGKKTPWHVIGGCSGEQAVEIRTDWAKRCSPICMWALVLVQKETMNSKAPLDLDVANTLKQMWKVEEGGAPKTWQSG
jgi:hypothetical protein